MKQAIAVAILAGTLGCGGAGGQGSGTPTAPTSVTSRLDGVYSGTWTDTCPGCRAPQTSTGTFSARVSDGTITVTVRVTSGEFGIQSFAGTVSSTGAIAGTGVAPPGCDASAPSFSGLVESSTMTIYYSRAKSGTCEAETGLMRGTKES